MIRYILIIIIVVTTNPAIAQFYNTGQDPASVNWMQINTEHFQVIYPDGFYEQANRFTNILESIYEASSATLDHEPVRIPVIMHTQSVISNGYVVWAPKRMEIVTTPAQDNYSIDWLEQLAMHEFRHVVQISKMKQGFTKFLSIPFGQMATGAMTGFIPFWFLEGDAIVNETGLSMSGRGREPSFAMDIKAIELDSPERLSYDQSYLGSYNHYVPNYYKYGYQMVSHANLKHGSKIWTQTLDNVGRRPFTITPFYFGLKKNGAGSKVDLYSSTFDTLHTTWQQQLDTLKLIEGDRVKIPDHRAYTSYRHGTFRGKDIIAVRTGIDDITRFVEINDGKEKIIHTPGPNMSNRIAVTDRYLAWEEIRYDPRWENRSYSIIKILDFETGKKFKLRNKTKHFSPAIRQDDKQIAVIANDLSYRSYLEIYNLESRSLLVKLEHPDREQLSLPTWVNDSILVVVATGTNGKSLWELNSSSGNWKELLGKTRKNISYPTVWQNYVLFRSTYDGTDNVYAVDRNKPEELFKITSARYGAFDPSVNFDSDTLLYSTYTVEGYRLTKLELDQNNWIPMNQVPMYIDEKAKKLSEAYDLHVHDSIYNKHEYESRNYNRVLNSFNLHSWMPFYIDLDELDEISSGQSPIYPGFTLLSQNKLSTLTSIVSYYFKDGEHHLKPTFSIRAWYPIIEFEGDFGGAPRSARPAGAPSPVNLQKFYKFSTKISVPLNLTYNKYWLHIQPYLKHQFENTYLYSDRSYLKGINILELSLSASHTLKRTARDIYPRWGQILFLSKSYQETNSSFWNEIFINNMYMSIGAYFPGFGRHHSFFIQGGYEGTQDRMSLPAGYSKSQFDGSISFFRYLEDYRKLNLRYTLPLFYPDFNIGPLVYFKRFHANAFYQYADYYGVIRDGNELIRRPEAITSIGVELAAEVNFLRFIFPVTPVFRYAWLPEKGEPYFDFYFTISTSIF